MVEFLNPMKLSTLTALVQYRGYHRTGRCNVCGKLSFFICKDLVWPRNNMFCVHCNSSGRKRHVAKILLTEVCRNSSSMSEIPRNDSEIKIYSADSFDSFHRVLRDFPGFFSSVYDPEHKTGLEIEQRVYCQDLESLTFESESFDAVITEDVFEHVRDHIKGFKSVHRVLKPNGLHIFTVPFNFDKPTLVRVKTSGDEDIALLPPEYHGDNIRGKILAYRTFGFDMFSLLEEVGFSTTVDFSDYKDLKTGIVDSFVFISKKLS
jgi:SAM-dependent methyltransferase